MDISVVPTFWWKWVVLLWTLVYRLLFENPPLFWMETDRVRLLVSCISASELWISIWSQIGACWLRVGRAESLVDAVCLKPGFHTWRELERGWKHWIQHWGGGRAVFAGRLSHVESFTFLSIFVWPETCWVSEKIHSALDIVSRRALGQRIKRLDNSGRSWHTQMQGAWELLVKVLHCPNQAPEDLRFGWRQSPLLSCGLQY